MFLLLCTFLDDASSLPQEGTNLEFKKLYYPRNRLSKFGIFTRNKFRFRLSAFLIHV